MLKHIVQAIQYAVALLIMVPLTVAFFIFLYGGMVASLLGFGAPIE